MKIVLCVFGFLIINPEFLLGRWQMVLFEAISKIESSPIYQESDKANREMADNMFKLALDSTYFEFKKDTVLFSDIKDSKIVHRKGRWFLEGDTIVINDLERIHTTKILVSNINEEEMDLYMVNSSGRVAKNKVVLRKGKSTNE